MAQQRKAALIIAVGGTLCLFSLLIFFSPRNQTNRTGVGTPSAPATMPKQSNAVVLINPSPTATFARRQLIDQGQAYGRNAEWQKAFDCFRQIIASGTANEYDWSYATASALAAGDTKASEQLCVQVMEKYGRSSDSGTAERCAKQCLVLPACSEDLLERACERANYAVRRDQKNRWGQMVKALAEYRRENWSVALDWVRQPETSSMLEISVQAWCVSAMARHQLGDAAGARKALEEVEARVKVLIQTGELGRSYDNRWDSIARGLALRAEAEQLILGKVVSPPLDPSQVIENRNKWQPVAFALDAADQMGKQAQWTPAAEYYKKLLQEPAFDWNVFEIKQDLLCQKIAVVFLMAGDQTNYCNLVQLLLARKWEKLAPIMQERYAQIFVSQPEWLSPDLRTQGLAYARKVCDSADVGSNPWLGLLRGETDYREGHFETALESLNQIFFPPSETDGAARAMAYKAMAYKRLGRSKEALEASQEANALFSKHMNRSGDWTNPTFHQLAMKELLGLLANTDR